MVSHCQSHLSITVVKSVDVTDSNRYEELKE